jgi:hypothetical protein
MANTVFHPIAKPVSTPIDEKITTANIWFISRHLPFDVGLETADAKARIKAG